MLLPLTTDCPPQTEIRIYKILGTKKSTAAIVPKLLCHGCLDVAGDSHPYMMMQRMGSNLHQLTHTIGLPTDKFVKVRY
jgi:hypothetical protein